MPDEQPGRLRPAFTLIELLVVIGIIAVLFSILLPTLSRARTQAKDLICESNVRQISQALLIYATDNRGFFPPAQDSTGVTWHVRIWSILFHSPFPGNPPDYTGAGTYNYLTNTIFECPQADGSRLGGYSTTDHRTNGYALNTDIPGSSGNLGMSAPEKLQVIRILENKKPYKPLCAAATLLLVDARGFYVEYFDRGSALNSMDAGISNAGGMLAALGRHAKTKDAWNAAFLDGSVRLLHFSECPGPPGQYYLVGNRLSPFQLLSNPAVSDDTRMFWVGQH